MSLYENTKEYLKGEIGDKELILKDSIDKGRTYVMDWWLKKSKKRYEDLLKMCKLVVFARKGFDTKAKKSVIIKRLKTKNIKFLNNKKIDISSTQLRNKIINGSKKN